MGNISTSDFWSPVVQKFFPSIGAHNPSFTALIGLSYLQSQPPRRAVAEQIHIANVPAEHVRPMARDFAIARSPQ